MATLSPSHTEREEALARGAKYFIFKGLWQLTTLAPDCYALLLKCEGDYDTKLGQGPYVLIERAHYVIDKNHRKVASDSPDMAKSRMIREGKPSQEFVHCQYKDAKEFREAMMMAHEETIEKKMWDVGNPYNPLDKFCCDMFSKATQFFLYDMKDHSLTFYGDYPPMAEAEGLFQPEKWLLDFQSYSHLPLTGRGKKVEEVLDQLNKDLEIVGTNRYRLPKTIVRCDYRPPTLVYGELHGERRLANRQAQLRDCLKGAVKKLLSNRVQVK